MSDTWNPVQYERFRGERAQPFFDLLALLKPTERPRVVDLGCGTGELTAELHRALGARATLGLDSSQAMLERSAAHAGAGLRFEVGDLARFAPAEPFQVLFSNAAVQWVDDHPALLARLTAAIAPGGQLAIQMPANHDHASHRVAAEVAREEPFRSALAGYVRESPVLAPERYAELLEELGYVEQHVRLQVYGHRLESAEAVVEWVKGTLLTDYQKRLAPEQFEAFLAAYRKRLVAQLGPKRPYFYAFKRLHLWGRRP
jgi:trans-aconitate 2-methyltransferase